MAKISVTYHAPEGDNKVVETRGLTFFDGQTQEIEFDDNKDFLRKAVNNPHFEVDGDLPKERKKRAPKETAAPEGDDE